MDARSELSKLILDGLMGRTLDELYREARHVFQNAGQSLSYKCFSDWAGGMAFPANRLRQQLLADVVGGVHGAAIRKLNGLAFRGYRKRVMREKDMGHKKRIFPIVNIKGADDIWRGQAQIVCHECGFHMHRVRSASAMENEDYFKGKGWEVGHSDAHDRCPACIEKRKVIKMSDHRKPPVDENREMSREDGRLVFRAIEACWDDRKEVNRYKPGWSDQKLAEKEGVPIAWIKAIRDRDFGPAGEDPGVTAYLAEQLVVVKELDELTSHLNELTSTVALVDRDLSAARQKTTGALEKYRTKHNELSVKVKRLAEVAARLELPFDKAV